MSKRGAVGVFGACLVLVTVECRPAHAPEPPSTDRLFCTISEQAGKPKPTLPEVESLEGRYVVSLYSADSGKVLDHLDITLTPTDTLHRFYKKVYDAQGGYRLERRKEELVAHGGERRQKWKPNVQMPPVALIYSEEPVVALFAPPHCSSETCVIFGMQRGMLLNIKQITKQGFAGTVDQIGVVSAERVPGQPWRLHGPHFFCALKER
jgi:hypothetical protein